MLGYTNLNVNNNVTNITPPHLLIANAHGTTNNSNLNHVNMATSITNNTSVLSACTGANGGSSTISTTNSKNLLNSSTIKMIQRILEESSQTGDLILTSKNLNEFPSKLANSFDLSDTITADLSKNHLTEFPKDLCQYDSLERLVLYSNQIRTIPDIGVYQLKCLKLLDLNSNNLSYLPPSLCNLVSLQVLTVNNNKLVSLPEEICRLDKLIQLDVSCNEITHLPVQIGEMASLRALNVRRNLLVELPKEIAQLRLVNFDCSSNRLSKLPLCFREMVTLIDLVVDHNPLEVPPAHICTKGLLHIMKYLLVEAIKEEKKRGILTEYEINTQYNTNFTNNYSNLNHQRSSCTNSTGSGSGSSSSSTSSSVAGGGSQTLHHHGQSNLNFGSFMFQSTVRNALCKKFSGSSSVILPSSPSSSSSSNNSNNTSSSHSSTSSVSSTISLNNVLTKPLTSLPPPPKQPPQPPQILPVTYLQTNGHSEEFLGIGEASVVSSPSSSASSTSCSPPLLLTAKTPPPTATPLSPSQPKPAGSIHELISTKQTISPPENNNNSTNVFHHHHHRPIYSNTHKLQQQDSHLNLLKLNRPSSHHLEQPLNSSNNNTSTILPVHYSSNNNNSNQQIWRLNSSESNAKLNNLASVHQHHLDANFSLTAGLSSSTSSPESSPCLISTASSLFNQKLNSSNSSSGIGAQQNKRPISDNGFEANPRQQKNIASQPNNTKSLNQLQTQNEDNSSDDGFYTNNSSSARNLNPLSDQYDSSSSLSLNATPECIHGGANVSIANGNNSTIGHHIIYDESLNPIAIDESCLDIANSDSNNVIISIDSNNHDQSSLDDDLNKYSRYQSNSQQVWIPRDDLLNTSSFYNSNITSNLPPNNLTLCNGKELPKDMQNINPAFTIRRHIIQIQEEQKQIESLRKSIEAKLKIQLPLSTTSSMEEFATALADGVVLCHLMNQIFPRAIQIIHVPTMAVPKLSLAKCRKNVENFIDACRRLGLQENDMCCAHDIIEGKNLPRVARTVIMLMNYNQFMQHQQQQLKEQHNNLEYIQQQSNSSLTTIGSVMGHHSTTTQAQQSQQQTAV